MNHPAFLSSSALATYYSILCSFNWMTAMSYNIMTKFRGTILPKEADRRRFILLCVICFGVPALCVCAVLGLDMAVAVKNWELQ